MRSYESVLIFDPGLTPDQLGGEVEKVEKLISSHGGEGIEVEHWDRREIAYVMKKRKSGHYVNIRYQCGNHGVVDELAAVLRITDTVVKFQTHRSTATSRGFKGNPIILKAGPRDVAEDEFGSDDDIDEID